MQAVVKGKAATVDLVEGARRILSLEAAEGRDPTEPGWAYPRQLALWVARVLDGAALVEYGPVDGQPAADS